MGNTELLQELTNEQIEKLLNYAPEFTEQNNENIMRLFIEKTEDKKKKTPIKKAVLVSLIAAMLLLCSGFALAGTFGVDLGAVYNSFFNVENVPNRINIGDKVVNNGIEITLVAAFADEDRAHMLLELKDLEGNRLSDDTEMLCDDSNAYLGAVVYDEVESKVSMALTMRFPDQVKLGDEVELVIDTLLSGISHIENEALDFNITADSDVKTVLTRGEWEEIAGREEATGALETTSAATENFNQFLKPDEKNLEIPEVDWVTISNIGFIDGKLHIQTKRTDSYHEYYNCGILSLIKNGDNEISPQFEINKGNYKELVFDVKDYDLKNIHLAVSGWQFDNIVHGPWKLSFNIESAAEKKIVVAEPTDRTYFSELEISCSPLKTKIVMNMSECAGDGEDFVHAAGDFMRSFPEPYLTLADGSRIELSLNGWIISETMGSNATYDSVYFDIADLRSITFCGEEYLFD